MCYFHRLATVLLVVIWCALPVSGAAAGEPAGKAVEDLLAGRLRWVASAPLVAPADRPEDPCVSIKDPSIVFDGGRWHVYATIKAKSLTKMEYLSFDDWKAANAAPRHVITLVDSYHCAPQAFYFRPQKKWYLVYQWGDKARNRFGPCYSTMEDVGNPQTLTKPVMLYDQKPATLDKGWLDFWVICDEARAHLFFTSLDGRMWRAQTRLEDFPAKWSDPQVVLKADIFEASHTYRLKGADKYLTIVEAQASGGRRYYKGYVADRLDGQWKPAGDALARPFAGQANVTFEPGVEAWSDCVSHGELLREGNDETMTVDPARLRFLFQGCSAKERAGKGYGQFPWRLGLLTAQAD